MRQGSICGWILTYPAGWIVPVFNQVKHHSDNYFHSTTKLLHGGQSSRPASLTWQHDRHIVGDRTPCPMHISITRALWAMTISGQRANAKTLWYMLIWLHFHYELWTQFCCSTKPIKGLLKLRNVDSAAALLFFHNQVDCNHLSPFKTVWSACFLSFSDTLQSFFFFCPIRLFISERRCQWTCFFFWFQ